MMKSVLTFLFAMFLMGSISGQLNYPNGTTFQSNFVGANVSVTLTFASAGGNINPSAQHTEGYTVVGALPSGVTFVGNLSAFNVTSSLITSTLTLAPGSSGTLNLLLSYRSGNDNFTVPITYSIAVATPLAVELVDFKAKLSNQKVSLNWLTAKEENINFFSVERSKNGQNFVEIARIKTGNAKKDYAFVDEKPYDGNSYYRLKVTENYGSKIQYSPVVTIAAQSKGLLKAYPSVAYNELIVELPEGNRETTLNIVDMTGKVIMIQKTSSLQLPIDVSSLIAGHYLIVAQNDLGKYVEKFMKQE
jgi:Secretion system C-terminal sorting domain